MHAFTGHSFCPGARGAHESRLTVRSLLLVGALNLIPACRTGGDVRLDAAIQRFQQEIQDNEATFHGLRMEFEKLGSAPGMWSSEFPTREAAHTMNRFIPILLGVTDGNVGDIYFYLAYSSRWARIEQNRKYVLQHFHLFRSIVLKTAWAVVLLEKGPLGEGVRRFLRSSLEEGWKVELIREIVGPDGDAIVERIREL